MNGSLVYAYGNGHEAQTLLFHRDHADDVHHEYVNEHGSFLREYARVRAVPDIKHIFPKALTFLRPNEKGADVLREI